MVSGLHIYLPPDSKFIDNAISELPKNCKDKDEAMNKEIRDVPHVHFVVNTDKVESGGPLGTGKERHEGVPFREAPLIRLFLVPGLPPWYQRHPDVRGLCPNLRVWLSLLPYLPLHSLFGYLLLHVQSVESLQLQ